MLIYFVLRSCFALQLCLYAVEYSIIVHLKDSFFSFVGVSMSLFRVALSTCGTYSIDYLFCLCELFDREIRLI